MSKRIFSLPIIPTLTVLGGWGAFWLPEKNEAGEREIGFALEAVEKIVKADASKVWQQKLPRTYSIFDVRAAFFGIESDADAFRFASAYGPFRVRESGAARITLSWLKDQQAFYRDALLHRVIGRLPKRKPGLRTLNTAEMLGVLSDLHLWKPLRLDLTFSNPLEAVLQCKDAEEAIRASVFLDRASGFTHHQCAREGCSNIFENKTKRHKIYCSIPCAHLAAVRAYNDRDKSESPKLGLNKRASASRRVAGSK